MAKQIVVTESSFLKLKAELEYLKNVKRKEAAENVGIARSFGDLSENSEYDEAKNHQGLLEKEIAELEEQLSNAVVKVIEKLIFQKNHIFCVASGRSYVQLKKIFE